MTNFVLIAVILIACINIANSSFYCVPSNLECWPNTTEWSNLNSDLNNRLHKLNASMYEQCYKPGKNAFGISETGFGICMQYHNCSKEFCDSKLEWNLPSYSVQAETVADIQTVFSFANKYNIEVTIKTSGHSYSGSSMGKGSILIWMHKFQKYGTIKKYFQNSCGKNYSTALKVGGGETWKDAYGAVKSDYHIVGGGGLTVAAAGGWLMGGGLSAMSRSYGIGIDNVIDFEVVLTNGTKVLADACSNTDLFWALRGGGGGSFGVVTSVHHRLRPAEKVVFATMNIRNIAWFVLTTVDKWIEKWVELSPKLDKRWGGYWTLNAYILYFLGNIENANETFLNEMYAWRDALPDLERNAVVFTVKEFDSYYDSRGGENATTDETGNKNFSIASRLIPREWVLNNTDEAKSTLKWLVRNGFYTFNYLLGGVMENVGANETAINPAARKAIWQIETFSEKMIQKLRDVVKDTGSGYNHGSKSEPDWKNAFWGSNVKRLNLIKKKYDPKNRLNCWHCTGYIGSDLPRTTKSPLQSTSKMATSKPSTSIRLRLSLTVLIAGIAVYCI